MTTSPERRRDLKRAFKDRPRPAGVFQIKNTINGKVLLGSRPSLDGVLNMHRFMLANGSHYNAALQKDWQQHGAGAFVFEILAVVQPKEEPGFDLDDELTLLEQLWLEKLGPLGDRGYNTSPDLRQA